MDITNHNTRATQRNNTTSTNTRNNVQKHLGEQSSPRYRVAEPENVAYRGSIKGGYQVDTPQCPQGFGQTGWGQTSCLVVGYPPPINADEHTQPRRTRSFLAQIRSHYSTILNSLWVVYLDNTISDTCPNCGQTPHNTHHLFNYRVKPTLLTTIRQWTDPWR